MTNCKICNGTGIIPPKIRLLCGCTSTADRLETRLVPLTAREASYIRDVLDLWGETHADAGLRHPLIERLGCE